MKTTSYETSKKLAEAGFKAETEFYWVKWNAGEPELVHEKEQTPALIEKVGAWDLETILEALPNFISNKNKNKGENCLVIDVAFGEIHYEGDSDNDAMFITTTEENESLADTAAKLWLKLKKEGLV